jgi:hypothetical protein
VNETRKVVQLKGERFLIYIKTVWWLSPVMANKIRGKNKCVMLQWAFVKHFKKLT